jgi:hypothetical protein
MSTSRAGMAWTITNSGTITVMLDDKVYSIGIEHMNYAKILDALKTKNYGIIPDLSSVSVVIKKSAEKANAGGNVEIKNGLIYFKGYIVDNTLTRRILDLINKDYPFDPMIKFLENLMENPSQRAVSELYTFLDVNNIPITEDGCFLAYKRVREDYMDIYTGKINNSVGQVVKMDRKEVDENSNVVCSSGLHACSVGYLKAFHNGEGHIMILKIHPRDVVSIPTDYHNTKMRVCEYLVLKELAIDANNPLKDMFTKPVYTAQGNESTLNTPKDELEGPSSSSCKDCEPCQGCEHDGDMTANACNDCDPCDGCEVGDKDDEDPCHNGDDCDGCHGCDTDSEIADNNSGTNPLPLIKVTDNEVEVGCDVIENVDPCIDCNGTEKLCRDCEHYTPSADEDITFDEILAKKNKDAPAKNKRDKNGRFLPKLGKKPDGKAYWNKRDKFGHFVRK